MRIWYLRLAHFVIYQPIKLLTLFIALFYFALFVVLQLPKPIHSASLISSLIVYIQILQISLPLLRLFTPRCQYIRLYRAIHFFPVLFHSFYLFDTLILNSHFQNVPIHQQFLQLVFKNLVLILHNKPIYISVHIMLFER